MKPTVLYIIGTSYSGSTVLGALLGQQPGTFAAGELGNWTLRPGSLNQFCSCGVTRHACPFWSRVGGLWMEPGGPEWLAYAHKQRDYERFRSIPVLPMLSCLNAGRFEQYAGITLRLYHLLQEVSGADTIVETSKRIGRARVLAQIGGLDLKYIHLVRDGRGYLLSTLKHKQLKQERTGGRPASLSRLLFRTSLEWVLTNRMAEQVITRSGVPSLRLHYEDFVHDPSGTIDRISAALSLDLSTCRETAASGASFGFGHMGGGNQVRLNGEAKILPDEAWRVNLPPAAKCLFWSLAGGTSRRYGYEP